MVVSGRDMTHANAQMFHILGSPLRGELAAKRTEGSAPVTTETPLNLPTADSSSQGEGPAEATIASTAAEPGFTPNVTFTRLGEHQMYTAIIAPSPESPYAHADKLPVLMNRTAAQDSSRSSPRSRSTGKASGGPIKASWWLPQTIAAPPVAARLGIAKSSKT